MNILNILCIGDVVGSSGCAALREQLSSVKRLKNIDMVIANGENSADGNGITPRSMENIFTSGVDVITTGNHVFRRREFYDVLDQNEFVIRPANYPDSAPGKGICLFDMGNVLVAVINIMGVTYMNPLDNPFRTADKLVNQAKEAGAKIIVVDFHAEATSEKKAMGYYLDGKVTAVFGTHTHVQTNDLVVLSGGTGYITDIGMCGPKNSVLGVKPEVVISRLKSLMPVRFENAEGEALINACIFEVDSSTFKTTSVEYLNLEV